MAVTSPTILEKPYTLAFALQLRKKLGKTSVRVAARASQADAVQYKNNEQYNTQRKIVPQNSTMS
jgi:N-acetylmuramoyl-L-alanine amidase